MVKYQLRQNKEEIFLFFAYSTSDKVYRQFFLHNFRILFGYHLKLTMKVGNVLSGVCQIEISPLCCIGDLGVEKNGLLITDFLLWEF